MNEQDTVVSEALRKMRCEHPMRSLVPLGLRKGFHGGDYECRACGRVLRLTLAQQDEWYTQLKTRWAKEDER